MARHRGMAATRRGRTTAYGGLVAVAALVFATPAGAQGTGGGNVTLTTGPGGNLFLTSNTSSAVFATSGDVVVNADRIIIQSDSGITSGGPGPHSVTIQQRSPDWSINLGSAEESGLSTLELTDAEKETIRRAFETSGLKLPDAAPKSSAA